MAYANGARGFWVGAIGSPDIALNTPGGIVWGGGGGGILVPDGYNYTLRGNEAMSLALGALAKSFIEPQHVDRKPPITYEEWIAIQNELDDLLKFSYFQKLTQQQVERVKALVQRRDGRRVLPPRKTKAEEARKKAREDALKGAQAWLACATPIHNTHSASRQADVNDYNDDALPNFLKDLFVGILSKDGRGVGGSTGGGSYLDRRALERRLNRSYTAEAGEIQAQCGSWPGPGPFPTFKGYNYDQR